MTLDELITDLTTAREKHGGDLLVRVETPDVVTDIVAFAFRDSAGNLWRSKKGGAPVELRLEIED